MTITKTPAPTATRLAALVKAEALQFFGNRTLMLMAATPLVAGLGLYFAMRNQLGTDLALAATLTEVMVPFTLMFAQFYAVLSMIVVRRDEKVLKRLRTGQARDSEILIAIMAPSALISVVLIAIYSAVVLIDGAPAPVHWPLLIFGILAGLVLAASCALLAANYTRNAEAAQFTSLPVILLAAVSTHNLRWVMPEPVQELLAATPFALLYDIIAASWLGMEPMTEADIGSWGFTEVSRWAAMPVLGLIVWIGVLGYQAVRGLKWETNR